MTSEEVFNMGLCPCGSKTAFEFCCGSLIAGRPALTAQALMRSRYTAFTIGDLDYLQNTSAGEAALKFNRAELALSLSSTEWLGLAIISTEAGQADDDRGSVTFTARLRENGRLHVQGERSEFRRVGGEWRYVSGEVGPKPEPGAFRAGRNDPCPCGSGKKFKKCHGA